MLAYHSPHGADPRTAARQAGAQPRRLAAVLAALICAVLASAATASAAFATPKPQPLPGGQYAPALAPPVPATIHVVTVGGMAGWQITLIAVGAALAAAAAVLLIGRARAARRATPAATA